MKFSAQKIATIFLATAAKNSTTQQTLGSAQKLHGQPMGEGVVSEMSMLPNKSY